MVSLKYKSSWTSTYYYIHNIYKIFSKNKIYKLFNNIVIFPLKYYYYYYFDKNYYLILCF